MDNRFYGNDPNLMKISELLRLFNLNLNLSRQILDLEVDICLKKSKLTVKENCYIFKFDDYSVTINPSDFNNTVIESQEANILEKLPSSICCYNSQGHVTYIS